MSGKLIDNMPVFSEKYAGMPTFANKQPGTQKASPAAAPKVSGDISGEDWTRATPAQTKVPQSSKQESSLSLNDNSAPKYNLLKGVSDVIKKGGNQIAQAGGDTLAFAEDIALAPFELLSGQKLGALSDTAPFNTWQKGIRSEGEQIAAESAENVKAGGKAAELFDKYGSATVAAAPQAVLALLTYGGSVAEQTTAGLAKAASSAISPSLSKTVSKAVSEMAKNPQYWSSFGRVVGSGYEQSIADQREKGETNENKIRTKAALYAVGNGLMNAAVEVGGGIQTLPSELQGGQSAFRAWVDSMVDEGKEEVVQGIIERGMQNLTYQKGNPLFSTDDENAVINPRTAAEEFAGGAVVGGILSGGQVLAGKAMGSIQPRLTDEDGNWYDAEGKKHTAIETDGQKKAASTMEADEPVRVGRATVLKNPYHGQTPTYVKPENATTPAISREAVDIANQQINKARALETETGKSFRNFLTDFYELAFQKTGGARKVPVLGVEMEGEPYEVSVSKNAVGKVISDKNMSAEKLAVFDMLDDIVQNGEYVGSNEYHQKGRKKKDTIRFDMFETPVTIDGRQYIVTFDVEVFPSTNNYRTHKVINEMDLVPAETTDTGTHQPQIQAAQGPTSEGSSPFKTGDRESGNPGGDVPSENSVTLRSVDVKNNRSTEVAMPRAVRSDAEIDGDLQRIRQEQAEKVKTVNSQEDDPRKISSVKELVDEDPEAAENVSGEDFSFAQQIQTRGVQYGKDLARNLDAAAGGNKELRERLRDVFERPMAQAKTDYAAEVRGRVNNIKTTMDKLGIKAGSRESAAVQWIGEGQRQDQFGNVQKYTEEQLKQDFPNSWENILEAEKYFRRTYDEYVDRINDSLMKIYPNAGASEKANASKHRDTELYYKSQANIQKELLETTKAKIAQQRAKLKRSNPASKRYADLQNSIQYQTRRAKKAQEKIERYTTMAERAASIAANMEAKVESREVLRNKRLMPRKDYFHHFQEMESGFKGLVTLLSTPADIDAKLAGQSEFTKPKTKWTGFMQQRKGGAYVEDAVGGMLKYIPAAEYKVSIDPQIARGRMLVKGMADATAETRNANRFIEWYTDYVSDLAGKTNPIDRPVQKLVGRKIMGALRWLNSRVKSNAVMGNMRSAVAQFFNLPNATAYVKNPVSWGKGLKLYAESLLNRDGARDVMNQSGFLNERYLDDVFSQFDEGVIKAPAKFANWMLSLGDKQATKLIWAAAYSDGVRKGETDPIFYADDLTRRSVAGRGIGEVPLTQKSQLVQLVAPFQVEVNNAWQLMKERVGQKDALGLLSIFVGNFIMNSITRWAFGFDVSYDPINALLESLLDDDDDDEDKATWEKVLSVVGRQGGELINAMPGGALYASYLVPDDTTRENLFGEGDPTRFGTGNIGLNMLMKPVYTAATGGDFSDDLISSALNIGMPFGGKQTERLINGAQDMGLLPELRVSLDDGVSFEKQNGGASYSRSGRLRFPIDTDDPWNVAKGLAFGTFATNEGKNYLESGASALSEKMTELYQTLVEDGISGADAYAYIQKLKEAKALESDKDENGNTVSDSKKKKVLDVINAMDLSKEQKDELYFEAGYKESTLADAPWHEIQMPRLSK